MVLRPSGGLAAACGSLASQPARQGLPERHGRDRLSMSVPDQEGLPRHVLVLPDAARHEVACALDRFRDSRVEVGKVDPLRVCEDLIAVENVKVEARHARKRPGSPKGCGLAWKMPRCGLI